MGKSMLVVDNPKDSTLDANLIRLKHSCGSALGTSLAGKSDSRHIVSRNFLRRVKFFKGSIWSRLSV